MNGPLQAPPKVGGKLLRPALCLLTAGAVGANGNLGRFVDLAAALELLHLAALTHDDVVDRSCLRRGTASLNALWNDHVAVLSGDYLVARAVSLLVKMNSLELIGNAFATVRKMTEGELRTMAESFNNYTQEDCLRLAEQKTASYFATTCTAPTYVLETGCREPLHQYGLSLGIAFQLIDDVLDLVQDQETLGKPACGDIAEGKRTLPILLMRQGLPPDDAGRLARMVGRTLSEEERAWTARALERSGARRRTEQIARSYASAAQQALGPLPSSSFKESMLGMTEFVLVRGF
ncbi:MAG: polyprenyl synthetase family protein [Candidatus Hydrogenedentes bacterium]|nr:polyprenyl synthetase family protein [Candidatus Hydrogenedentota bacterium]